MKGQSQTYVWHDEVKHWAVDPLTDWVDIDALLADLNDEVRLSPRFTLNEWKPNEVREDRRRKCHPRG